MLVIRLTRVGKKNTPAFRVVVAEKKRAAKRKFIEILGHYNPSVNPKTVVIDKDKALEWMKKGAQPSDTVRNLMCDLGILAKTKKIKIIYGRATKKKDNAKKGDGAETKIETKENPPADETESVEESTPESAEPASEVEEENTDGEPAADVPETPAESDTVEPQEEQPDSTDTEK